ncbi:MAG: T9SS type A sorting domain-containing protein [Ignavibacteria bacterium]|nr:T9SS type A sorting domain-containing protein [Ignavibacteria bacterium]
MKFYLKYIIILFFLLPKITTYAIQTQYSSYEGTHFFVGFMQNEISIDPRYGGLHLKLFIFPSSTTNIKVIFPNDSLVEFFNVNTTKNLEISVPIQFENYESEVIRKKSVEIISENPILVYGFSTQYLTSDAYTAIPVEKWGKEYVIVSIANDQYNTTSDIFLDPVDSLYRKTPRQSEFLIIAAYDSTNITFFPKAITEKGLQIGYPKNLTLNKGQTYLVKSFPFAKGYGDLSGTVVRGDKPFGVISGHVRTAIPQNLVPKWDSKNHLCEMLMPTNSWGREFITVPFGTSPFGDLIKITSYFPNTTITSISQNGTQTFVLSNNYDVLEIPYVAEPRKWISDKPIQMAQFIMHSGTDWDSPNYDPAMTLVPPIEQFVTNVTFQTPANITWNPSQFVAHFVNLIGTIDALNETYINSTKIVDLTNNVYIYKLFNDTYFWANIKIPYGRYQINTNKGKIAGIVYGVGLADAYALVLGSSLVNPYIGDSVPPELVYSAECGKIQGYFYEQIKDQNTGINYIYVISDSTYNFVYFLPNITDTTTFAYFNCNVVDPFKQGKIVIEVRDRNGNSKRLSYFYEPPSISLPNEIVFTQVKPYDTLRKSVLIRNTGKNLNVLSISFSRADPRFRWNISKKLPFDFLKNDTFSIFVQLTPNGNLQENFDTLLIQLDCNLTLKIPIRVEFLNWKFKTIGYDFGKVYIGDTAYGKVGIINLSDLPISFDSIAFKTFPNVFKMNYKGKFNLKIGDTAYFDVLFYPNQRMEFISSVVFFDELKARPEAEIKGIGVAPLIEPLIVDFGKVRVGHTKDTVVYFVNKGNIEATLDFQYYDKFESFFSGNLEQKNVKFLDTLPIYIKFEPSSVGIKTQKVYYKVNWKYHNLVTIELIGEGILPEIKTQDAIFDTIFVYDKISKDFSIVFSTGTDDLFVKEIIPLSGDISSFDIDYSLLKNLLIPKNSFLSIPITFKPSFVGTHQMELLVFSDATPSDTFITSKIKLIGYAKSRDTLNANLLVKYLVPEYVCNLVSVDFSIENTGNIPFPIYGTRFEMKNFSIINADTLLTGKFVFPNEKLNGKLTGIPEQSGDVNLKITIIYGENGDSTLFKEIQFALPKMKQTILLETQGKVVKIGEESSLLVKGKFLGFSAIPFDLNFSLEVENPSQVMFLDNLVDLELFDSQKIWKLPINKNINGSSIQVVCNDIKVNEPNTQWSIRIPFRTYLTNELIVNFKGNVSENSCFTSFENSLNVPIEPYCVHPLRNIELINGAFLLNYYPIPIEDELFLEFISNQNDLVLIDIFDNLGNVVLEKSKIEINAGLNLKKINLQFLENGIYFVKLYFVNRTKEIMVIKLK